MKIVGRVTSILLFITIAVVVVVQIPANVFGVASNEQYNGLINSVCRGENSDGNDDYIKDANRQYANDEEKEVLRQYCELYFMDYLSSFQVDHQAGVGANLTDFEIEMIERHVNWWGNAANQNGRAYDDGRTFLMAYCETTELIEPQQSYSTMTASKAGVIRANCSYSSGAKMKNSVCNIITVFGVRVECFSSETEANEAITGIINDNSNSADISGDDCGKGDPLAWMFCGPARVVTTVIDTLLNEFLLPMLQWRIII